MRNALGLTATFALLVSAAACGSGTDAASSSLAAGGVGGSTGNGTDNSGVGGLFTTGSGSPGSGGSDGGACAVASAEATKSPVDVIMAIDQSASMGEEIAGVIDNVNVHLAQILDASGIDYRVILVSGDFCIAPPLGAGSSPPECYASNPPRFFHAPAPVNSSDALTLFLWTYDGFYKQPNTCTKVDAPAVKWKDQVRFESHKVFVAVTDDDPYSFSAAKLGCSNCPNHQCPTFADSPADWGGADFPTELYKLEPAGVFGTAAAPKWTFHSIVPVHTELAPGDPIQPLAEVCELNGNTGETSGVEYQELSKLTGGIRFPSCDTDYSPVFQKIASTIVPLACVFMVDSTGLGEIDPMKTNVTFTPGNGPAETILNDESVPCEMGADGWQWTDNFTKVVLCGAACDKVKADPAGKVTIEVGCQTQIAPPN